MIGKLLHVPFLLALLVQTATAQAPEAASLASRVKELLRTRCFECHGGSAVNGGVKVLDPKTFVGADKAVIPGRPDDSPLWQRVTADDDSTMPPEGQPRLSSEDISLLRQWIVAGAPPFPDDVARPAEENRDPALAEVLGVDYVYKRILKHLRSLPNDQRPYVRYFSINHLLTGGATREELDTQRAALAKAINHLSLEQRLAVPRPIDAPLNTVFAVDIRELGWQKRPFEIVRGGKSAGPGTLNLFDLALLEYPYAAFYEDSETYESLLREFVLPARLARPIVYVRADWFTSVATQAPLYEDFLQLPFTLDELERRLGADTAANLANNLTKRAGMTVSGVSRNNRVVERHAIGAGAYWKSFDFASSKGRQNMFRDPVNLEADGGEMIFNLPNGLQGYLITNAKGVRVDSAPTQIVTDKFAEDKTVRNGLSCIRCHDGGMKSFADTVRPALERLPGSPGFDKRQALRLYPPQEEMESLIKEDAERFLTAAKKAMGSSPAREPITAVSQRFLDAPLQLSTASAELGLPDARGLEHVFRSPQFAGLGLVPLAAKGVVRRDMWEDYYGQIVRQLGLGVPVAPLDALTRTDISPDGIDVQLSTSKKNNVFTPGDELTIFVTNRSAKDLHIELIGSSATGRKVILAPATTTVKPGQQFRFPPTGSLKVQGGLGKETITLYASDADLPAGEFLRGTGVVDRVVHDFYKLDDSRGQFRLRSDPARVVKKTIEIETR